LSAQLVTAKWVSLGEHFLVKTVSRDTKYVGTKV
jgi:hypothetical protein